MSTSIGSNLQPNALKLKRVTVADADYAVTTDPVMLIAYTSITATRTVTLPTPIALDSGRTFTVKDESGSVSPTVKITIVGAGGETIDGSASVDIDSAYGEYEVYTDGVNYFSTVSSSGGAATPLATVAASSIAPDDAATIGVSTEAARADHKHGITAAIAGSIAIGDTAAEGTAPFFARSDHRHALTAPAAPVDVTKAAASAGAATTVARSDHKHDVSTAAPASIGSANSEGSATSLSRSDHVHNHGSQTVGTMHAVANPVTAGFMSSADFNKLAGITVGAAPNDATYLTVTAHADLSAEVPVTDLPSVLQFARNTAATSTITDILELSSKTTGTGAIGLGAGLLYTLESNSGNLYDAARAAAITTYAVDGSETSAWVLQLKKSTSDTLQEVLRVDSADGALQDVTISSDIVTFPPVVGHTAIKVIGTYNTSTSDGSLITLDNTATVGGKLGLGLYFSAGPYFMTALGRSLRFISRSETYAAGGDDAAYMFTPEDSTTRPTISIWPHYLSPGYSTSNLTNWIDGGTGLPNASVTYEGKHKWSTGNQQTTVGAAGAASALPLTPEIYLQVKTASGATVVIPAYLP